MQGHRRRLHCVSRRCVPMTARGYFDSTCRYRRTTQGSVRRTACRMPSGSAPDQVNARPPPRVLLSLTKSAPVRACHHLSFPRHGTEAARPAAMCCWPAIPSPTMAPLWPERDLVSAAGDVFPSDASPFPALPVSTADGTWSAVAGPLRRPSLRPCSYVELAAPRQPAWGLHEGFGQPATLRQL